MKYCPIHEQECPSVGMCIASNPGVLPAKKLAVATKALESLRALFAWLAPGAEPDVIADAVLRYVKAMQEETVELRKENYELEQMKNGCGNYDDHGNKCVNHDNRYPGFHWDGDRARWPIVKIPVEKTMKWDEPDLEPHTRVELLQVAGHVPSTDVASIAVREAIEAAGDVPEKVAKAAALVVSLSQGMEQEIAVKMSPALAQSLVELQALFNLEEKEQLTISNFGSHECKGQGMCRRCRRTVCKTCSKTRTVRGRAFGLCLLCDPHVPEDQVPETFGRRIWSRK